MKFAQVIEFHTDRVDEIRAVVEEHHRHAVAEDRADRPRHRTLLHDREHPDRYFAIVEFDSYEAAMAHNERPETTELAHKLRALASRPAAYTNCDVLEDKDL